MTTLTYQDLLYIREALVARRETTLARSRRGDDQGASDALLRSWKGMGEALGRVETMLAQSEEPITTLNARTIAALNEPAAGVAHSVSTF